MPDAAPRVIDGSPRTRIHRSQTSVPTTVGTAPRTVAHPSRRSLSQDSVARQATAMETAKSTTKSRTAKKGSSHADVIDRMDFSGVGAVFHHDSPFDACAPSRNRHRTKAPMMAWTGGANPEDDVLVQQYSPRIADSPYAAARTPAPYTPAEPWSPPKKNHDALAEAWGIHEPEPYEEFFAGGGSRPESTYASRNGSAHAVGGANAPTPTRRPRDRDAHREHLDDAAGVRRAGTKTRNALPPPKPIFVPEAESGAEGPPSPSTPGVGSPGAPKRTKSLMNRIRRMRENPNVPAGHAQYDDYGVLGASPPNSADLAGGYRSDGAAQRPSRPTHRAQNSFLGRLGGGKTAKESSTSPTSDSSDFVYVGYDECDGGRHGRVPRATNKDLPATPPAHAAPEVGYFDGVGASGGPTSPGASLGRKTSLLKKVKGAMRGAKSVERR
ncbi:hypothetical protein PUNSTDRAFT_80272 [Punctularia strigosozonata HHB-11173 SS5]|uniref:uncharacterized protein n=1 Tax=Punctularia strigosozonata (strain HHB-11173) TaxID=741275 RepID=UPI0004417CDC|nr:uncharacterized protein PUNSTDRAFT_80272 [Punctularia strigosozonata HHB-11173 SS5]EIN14154.1 hypothetical protein PUNSTDRAFT_80272 [Punctularia strigosozonata HHB-11173 SS5]